MEQFLPNNSKIFSAASFVNIYASIPLMLSRIAVAIFLIFSILISSQDGNIRVFRLLTALIIIVSVFEIYFFLKITKEKPLSLTEGASNNLADSFSLELARLFLKTENPDYLVNLLRGLFKNKKTLYVLERADITLEEIHNIVQNQEIISKRLDLQETVNFARSWALKEKRVFIDKLDILLALISQTPKLGQIIFEKGLKEADLLNIVFWTRKELEKDYQFFWEKPVETLGPGIAEFWAGGWTVETEKYAVDITKELQKNKISSTLVGRYQEVTRIEEVLARSDRRNIILLGPPGVGKKTIVYGLAEKSILGLLPPALKYKRFLELDLTSLLAGAREGELEERIKNLLTELTHAGNVVLFIPDLENLAGASGTGVNISGHLINSLGSGKLQVIATSTRIAHRRYIENQGTFASLFEGIDIDQPSISETIRILQQNTGKIEASNKITVSYKAIQKTVELADRYMVDRVLPGKAIDLIDEVATAVSIKGKGLLEPEDVEEVVSQKTKTPVKKATGEEAERLINLEKIIHQRIINQEEAIVAISNALRRARTIERETKRPIGSFLFLGPTGVGKTETAKALSEFYFKSEDTIIRIDMSEYQSIESINRLIGAPPGTGKFEEGGEFTEKVRQNPYCLILLDEMEKAHPKIQEAFLPVFDEGVLEDTIGRKIIFSNTIIIATSNAGAEFIRESINQNIPLSNLKKVLLEKLQRDAVFKPEFLNRFDDIIVYKPLNEAETVQVVILIIKELEKRLAKQDVSLSIDPQTLNWIAKNGYDPTYGARPLRRFVADNLEEKIAEKILSNEIQRGSQVNVRVENNQLVVGG